MERKNEPHPASDERTGTKSAVSAHERVGLREKAERGHYGDLRLLGLSAGFVVLIILGGLLRGEGVSRIPANVPIEKAVVFAPPVFAAPEGESSLPNLMFEKSGYYGVVRDDVLATRSAEKTPKTREKLSQERAENGPET